MLPAPVPGEECIVWRISVRTMPAAAACLAGIVESGACSFSPPERIYQSWQDSVDVVVTLPPLRMRRGERYRTTFPRPVCDTPHTFMLRGPRGLAFSATDATGPFMPVVAGVVQPGETATEAHYWVSVDTSVAAGDTLAAEFTMMPAGMPKGATSRAFLWRRPIVVVRPLPGATPTGAFLAGIYPNPFNPATRVSFRLAVPARVRLEIYDARGVRVATPIDRRFDPGSHTFAWDGASANGRPLASGVYFARLSAGSATQTLKLLLLK